MNRLVIALIFTAVLLSITVATLPVSLHDAARLAPDPVVRALGGFFS